MRLDKLEQTRLELLGGINIKWREMNREESRKIFFGERMQSRVKVHTEEHLETEN